TAVHFVILVRIAWVALGISILCGVIIHFAWSKFFISFRDFDNRNRSTEGKLNRKKWTSLRRAMEFVQFLSLLIGVMGIRGQNGWLHQSGELRTRWRNSAQDHHLDTCPPLVHRCSSDRLIRAQ